MITDGTSNTLMAVGGLHRPRPDAELRRAPPGPPSDPVTGPTRSPTSRAPGPASAAALAYQINNCGTATGKIKAGGPIGHTRWANGGVYYSGFTTAMPPNHDGLDASASATGVRQRSARILPMDWDWVDENDGGPTYMSLAASSNHPGGVNALFADGSVHFVKNSVSPVTWYGLGHHRRRRGHQLRSVLIRTSRSRVQRPRARGTGSSARGLFCVSDAALSNLEFRNSSMRIRFLRFDALAAALRSPPAGAADAGAATLPSLIPVKGKVTYKGQPLTKGTVRFEPDGYGRMATGKIQPDGTYVLSHVEGGRRRGRRPPQGLHHRTGQEARQGSRVPRNTRSRTTPS